MAKLNYKELQKEFEEEFGTAYDGNKEAEKILKDREKDATLEKKKFVAAVNEAIDSYIRESVDHFLHNSTRNIFEDGRYFYSTKEFEKFMDLYKKKGGNLDTIHTGIVKDKHGDFFCYEVCHKAYYENPSPYVLRIMEKFHIKNLFYS